MGFLGDLFHYAVGGTTNTYSNTKVQFTTREIESVVSMTRIRSLDRGEKAKVIDAIKAVRQRNDKVSLKDIGLGLVYLRRKGDISPEDYKGIMGACEKFFTAKQQKEAEKKKRDEEKDGKQYDITY